MKHALLLLTCVLLITALATGATARKGVGIVWSTQTQIVSERGDACVTYGIYNPWEEDVQARIDVTDSLKEVMVQTQSESRLIPAGTSSSAAKEVELCFEVPRVYEEDCVVGAIGCQQTCQEEQKTYSGEVVVIEDSQGAESGSATVAGVSAPLTIKVSCDPHTRNWTSLIIVLILLALGVTGGKLYYDRKEEQA